MAWLALAGYALFLAANMSVVAGGSDSSGYLNSARLLAAAKLHAELRVPAEFGAPSEVNGAHFTPQGFNLFSESSRLAPTYPTGLPLHFALASRLFGWSAGPFLVQLLAAVGAVWLCYVAARELGVNHTLAGAAATMLAAFPVFVFTSIQTLSDTLATTWTLAALCCGLRARVSRGWAAACGAAFAVAVLVRPTNFLLAPALLVLIGLDARRLALLVAGGLPGAIWLAWYNQQLYGGMLRSGYGNIFDAFSVANGLPTAVHFATWLAWFAPAVVLVLPFAALASRATRGQPLAALALAFAAIAGTYLWYDVSREVWWCLRFILPAVAALILAAILGVEALARGPARRWPRGFRAIAALVLTTWAAGNSWYWTRNLHILHVQDHEQAYAAAAEAVRQHVPENTLVVCSIFSGSIYYYTPLPVLYYDAITPADFTRYATLAGNAGRPVYAVLFEMEEGAALRRRCPGSWTRVTSLENVSLWKLQ